MRCVRSPAHLRPRMRAHKLAFTPQIVIDTNSPAHAESSPHVRRTLDINRESDIHAVAGTLQTPISIHALRKESDPGTLRLTKRSKNFNPHSPCGERPNGAFTRPASLPLSTRETVEMDTPAASAISFIVVIAVTLYLNQ